MKKFFVVVVLFFSVLTLSACNNEGLYESEDQHSKTTIETKKSVFLVEQTVRQTVKDLGFINEIQTDLPVEGGKYFVAITMRTRASEWGKAEAKRLESGNWQYTFHAETREELETITLVYRTGNTPIWYGIAGVAAVLVGASVYLYQRNKAQHK